MASLGSASNMDDCLNVALLDPPTSPTSPKQGGITAPLDFSYLTPSKFGITTNSFSVPSKPKDKSRVLQLKDRRRSTIGARGSPETNSLIRYIAKQRMQAPSPATEHLRLKSSLPRSQSLKQKMAAFQFVMEDVDEEEKLESMITLGKKDQKLDRIWAGKAQSDHLSLPLGKENRVTPGYLAPTTPPPMKRVCRGPLQECEGKITGTTFSVPACTSQEEVQGFDFQSPIAHQDTAFHRLVQHMPFPVLAQQMKTNLNHRDESGISSVTNKKRVHFGVPLSPEFFDKTLPPSTPLQKGATPLRQPASSALKLRSLLKTPQRNEASLRKPNFISPEAGRGIIQTKVLEGTVSSDIVFRDAEDEIPRFVLEEEDEVELEAELNSAEDLYDLAGISKEASSDELAGSQAHVVTSLCKAEPLLEEQTVGAEPELITSPQQEPPPLQQQEQQDPATSSSPGRPRGRKRKQPAAAATAAESEPQSESRRPSRTASTSASGKKTLRAQRHSEPKRVHFGAPLSPEFFDKTLPSSTPLKKGSTPFRHPASAGAELCPVLKTALVNEAPEAGSGSPTLSQTKGPEAAVSSDLILQDTPEEQIPRLLLEEDDEVEPEVNTAGIPKDASSDKIADSQAPNMNSPSQVEPLLEEQTEAELELLSYPQQQQQSPPPPPPLQQQEQQDSATSSSPARPRGRKRKPMVAAAAAAESEPQPERRTSSRSAAHSASGKMKDSTGKRRFGGKDVDRSLYGKRAYASKNPLLSPIFEPQLSNGVRVTTANHSEISTVKASRDSQESTQKNESEVASDIITAATRWRQRFCPESIQEISNNLTETMPSPEIPAAVSEVSCLPSQTASSTTPRGKGRPGPKPKPKTPKAGAASAKPTVRRSRGRRSGALHIDAATHVSEAQSAVEEHENEFGQRRGQIHTEAESTLHRERDRPELSPHHSSEGTHEVEALRSQEPCEETEDQTETSTDCRHTLTVEGDGCDEATRQHLEPVQADKQQQTIKHRGRARRKSSLRQPSTAAVEALGLDEEREVTEERESEHRAPSGLEDDSGSANVSSKDTDRDWLKNGAPQQQQVTPHTDNTTLAPWQQTEFSIEDVLRPVAAARRGSVRRSLRNRSEQGSESGASGLAWVAHTSPDITTSATGGRAGRRKTRSRLSITLQPQSLPEEPEPQDEPEPADE